MPSRDFKDLQVWKKSIESARLTYQLAKKLPKEELYALSDQMRRSAVSIASNIAEGQQRIGKMLFVLAQSLKDNSNAPATDNQN